MNGDLDVNPYSGYGTLAVGARFVGRKEEYSKLAATVLRGVASRALVGLPRVGKSSLALKVFQAGLKIEEISCTWIDVGSIDASRELIHEMLTSLPTNEESGFAETYLGLKSLLQQRRRQGRRTVLVLDGFDAIRRLPNAAISVRRLRELIADPSRYGLAAVFVCRRRLADLEEQIPDLSNLANACPSIYLRPFCRESVVDMVTSGRNPPSALGWDVNAIVSESGGFPSLIEESLSETFGSDVRTWSDTVAPSRNELFREIWEFLDGCGALGCVEDVHRGIPVERSEATELLEDYGVLSREGDDWSISVPLHGFGSDSPVRVRVAAPGV